MDNITARFKRVFFYLFERAAQAGFITVFIYTATGSLLITFVYFVLLFLAFIGCDD